MDLPTVYTLTSCPACQKLRETWGQQGIEFEERAVDKDQRWMDAARNYGDTVPIIVYPDGRVQEGFLDEIG